MADINSNISEKETEKVKKGIPHAIFWRTAIVLFLDVIGGILLKTMRDGAYNLEIGFSINVVNKRLPLLFPALGETPILSSLPIASAAMFLLALLAAVFFIVMLALKKSTSNWIVTPLLLAGIFLFLAAVPLIFQYSYYSRYMVTALVMIVVSAIYFVYNLFMHIFYK